MDKPIGVIDSGIGGLTVASEIIRQLPKEEILYIGDTKRCPYGPRDEAEVRTFTWEMIDYLMSFEIKLLVIACNTASAVVLEEAAEQLPIPVLGVIHPGAVAALKATKNKEIGVIGTEGTISSGAYYDELRSINGEVKVVSAACPTLVPLVEAGDYFSSQALKTIESALEPMLMYSIDSLILGCTHYPMIEKQVKDVMGTDVEIICSGDETAREVSSLMYHKNMLYVGDRPPQHIFYTTGGMPKFRDMAENWLGMPDIVVKQTDLGLTAGGQFQPASANRNE
ncbi:glutamate racemase [Salisediminibacterium halotolerans]|uniref:Glutamate racemase n=1 Tax=Salisediminibacterium halotolerans TaxID=517425 RepID=A0A1H9U317_9BACI|nr:MULTISPECIES: glutamate racemase [Salisediminibacterium]RLJ81112.1 glutamate racemase [Actinophytocola xinjiangensis]RPE84079.1 glutamate racemase [Salisediminibacterium halotolerans]TWG38539.1 glutamate racemase [Salisediminibacterium halotolerans]SES03631.1 glutamate racemase [Salisediminibacterium haloalkalitolerans]GEL07185.1 glutamate racemase [Salisediminibacterium halotolerans]